MKAAIWQTPTLTRFMALVAWLSVSTAVACAIYPAPGDAIFVLLAGVTALLAVRSRMPIGLLAAFGLALLFLTVVTALEVTRADPSSALEGPPGVLTSGALRDPSHFTSAGIGALMVLVTLAPAAWVAQALFGTPVFDLTTRRRPAGSDRAARVVGRHAGHRRMEAELARASRDLREVSFALLGVDSVDRNTAGEVMGRLDELVLASLTPTDTMSEHALSERLVVLPGVSAAALAIGVGHLCGAAEPRLGRRVRAALATFPHDGPTVGYLLEDLEQVLASCRTRDTTLGAVRSAYVAVMPVTQTIGRR